MLEVERGSTRSQGLENSLWKGLWTCHKTDSVMVTPFCPCRLGGMLMGHLFQKLHCRTFYHLYNFKIADMYALSVSFYCAHIYLIPRN